MFFIDSLSSTVFMGLLRWASFRHPLRRKRLSSWHISLSFHVGHGARRTDCSRFRTRADTTCQTFASRVRLPVKCQLAWEATGILERNFAQVFNRNTCSRSDRADSTRSEWRKTFSRFHTAPRFSIRSSIWMIPGWVSVLTNESPQCASCYGLDTSPNFSPEAHQAATPWPGQAWCTEMDPYFARGSNVREGNIGDFCAFSLRFCSLLELRRSKPNTTSWPNSWKCFTQSGASHTLIRQDLMEILREISIVILVTSLVFRCHVLDSIPRLLHVVQVLWW
jgi:hypothetical protein